GWRSSGFFVQPGAAGMQECGMVLHADVQGDVGWLPARFRSV
ncbi:MAG: hypothetical protein AVDCRST_MAG56-2203, partial [uncultured Cytophagales bacterium]